MAASAQHEQGIEQAERSRHPRGRRVRLPTSRSLIGGALIVASAAGVLVAHRAATSPPTTRHVVVTRDVPAGTSLRADDLGTVVAELPPGVGSVPEANATDLVGRVVRTGLSELDLVRPGDLFEPGRFPVEGSVELAVDLPPSAALAGTIAAGSVVDVLSTDPEGAGTSVIAEDVRVSEVDGETDDRGIGGGGTVRVRLGLRGIEIAERVIDAAIRTELSLILPAPAPVPGQP